MNNIGILILKPDAIQDGLTGSIQQDVRDWGFDIIYEKAHQFTPDQMGLLCAPSELGDRRLTAYGLIHNYLSGESLILFLRKESTPDIVQEILKLKGKVTGGGLRFKYFPYDNGVLSILEDIDPLQFGLMKGRNRVHSPDTREEMLVLMDKVLSKDELRFLELYNEVKELRSIGIHRQIIK